MSISLSSLPVIVLRVLILSWSAFAASVASAAAPVARAWASSAAAKFSGVGLVSAKSAAFCAFSAALFAF